MKQILLDLAQRCEAAEGPDRGLDRNIHQQSIVWNLQDGVAIAMPFIPDERIPHLTASIDSAMMLVPEGWMASLDFLHSERGAAVLFPPDKTSLAAQLARAATPALAICAAALRARAELVAA